ncbi:MAG TPA: hypothetical protein VG722_00390, partial [Tepidisphaeraceae bacterium]|nr:hypothetical protein [Tepidisphaeraceae bacterium]
GALGATALLLTAIGCETVKSNPPSMASLSAPVWKRAIASREDFLADEAMKQPGGPNYEFFARLLPPARYVDADFHVYPIPLSAPSSRVKGRVLSDGSQINALARQPNWVHEMGIPVRVLIGDQRRPFGADLANLSGPRYLDGYLPVVTMQYTEGSEQYQEEAFASVDSSLAPWGTILVRFTFPDAHKGRVELRFADGYDLWDSTNGQIEDAKHHVVAGFDDNWEYNKFHNALISKPGHARTAVVAIYTAPIPAKRALSMSGVMYDQQRSQCEQTYNDLLSNGMTVNVPEARVNDAWRSLVISMYTVMSGDDLNYSAGNQYARMYAAETGDSDTALLLWGHAADVVRNIPPLLRYVRPNITFHDGAFKLQLIANFYRETRDIEFIRSIHPLWQREIDHIVKALEPATGLLPREKYCSDINTPVHSLASNAACWRGLHDMIPVLDAIGQNTESEKLQKICDKYRDAILKAMDKNIVYIPSSGTPGEGKGGGESRKAPTPTHPRSTERGEATVFVPVAMGGEEAVHDPITATRIGSYWNLVIGYVLDSGIFPYDSKMESDIVRYLQTHGGLCMGLVRCQSAPSFWINTQNINILYGLRYARTLAKRDEPDRQLVSFYAALANGLTRDTFIGAEAVGLEPLDRFGRQMYLPPNTSAAGYVLSQLRYMLVEDWRNPDALRLLFATPRAWLADGNTISVKDAPTAYGPLSMTVQSHINRGQVSAELDLPDRSPNQTFLRLRLPDGHRLIAASAAGKDLKISNDTIDLTGLTGHVDVDVKVK